jgi:hypothetical protein
MTTKEADWLKEKGGVDSYFEEDEDDGKDDFNQLEFTENLTSNLKTQLGVAFPSV